MSLILLHGPTVHQMDVLTVPSQNLGPGRAFQMCDMCHGVSASPKMPHALLNAQLLLSWHFQLLLSQFILYWAPQITQPVLPWVGKRSSLTPSFHTFLSLLPPSYLLINLADSSFYLKTFFFGIPVYEILGLWPGFEPAPPTLEVWHLNHCTTREVLYFLF